MDNDSRNEFSDDPPPGSDDGPDLPLMSYEAEISIPIWITLECTHHSRPAVMYGPGAGPAEGPEFEDDEIRAGEDRELRTEGDLIDFVGLDEARRLLDEAKKEAAGTGEF